jgi:hypothetical protein
MVKKSGAIAAKLKTPPSAVIDEEIEGLDGGEDSGFGDYPIDTLLIRKETRTVFDVVRRITNGGFVLNPDFQRDFVWDNEKQSRLIESIVLRIPLPVFYLAEDKQGRTIVGKYSPKAWVKWRSVKVNAEHTHSSARSSETLSGIRRIGGI